MSDTTEQTGTYQPPVAPKAGDDGFAAPGTTHEDDIAVKNPTPAIPPAPKMNSGDLRTVMQSTCDTVAGWCDVSDCFIKLGNELFVDISSSRQYNRDLFAKELVAYGRKQWGEFNWVICHSPHSYMWMGSRSVDWEHWHYELDVYGAGTIGYELYWAREGVFTLNGDGGFINWAYVGNVDKLNDKTLYFHTP
ncbi:hypothetical protein NMY22_g13969 [Coprinellus aureogranulatus]|nr:hypothetical protein NMY22_g13969 [Coprinellus aureogranulatus]